MLTYYGKVTRRLPSVLLGGALLLTLGACSKDENTLLVFGPDSAVVVAPMVIPAFELPPTGLGTANRLELVSFDPVALDAFGRTNAPFQSDEWPFWRSGGYWRWGVDDPDGYDWDTGDVDPRLPALTRTTPLDDPWRMYIAVQGVFAGDGYDIYGETCCLELGVDYAVGFERMYLQVNGELDASQILLGQAVSDPDELKLLGGTPGGDYTRRADLFNDGSAYPSESEANPFVFGIVTGDPADGYIYLDVVVSCNDASGMQVWMCDETPNQSLSVVAPNQQVPHNFPNYNYITFWELNPDGSPNYSRPVIRKQLGVDLSEFGSPINNAYAPFPRAAMSDDELAQGTGAVSRPDSVEFVYENLEEGAGSAGYQLWAVDDAGGYQALQFIYTRAVDGTVSAPDSSATSFSGGPGTHTVKAEYPDGALYLLLSFESSTGASQPGSAQILWAAGLQDVGQVKSLDLATDFGTFGERVWAISGQGRGGLYGNEFRERFELLPRPPVGYQYVGWLSSGDTLFVRLPDESFTDGPRSYTPLTNADTDDTISDMVQPNSILTAFTRICVFEEDTNCSGPFDLWDYDTFFLTLEPFSGVDTPAPTRVLEAAVPEVSPPQ